MPRHSPKGDQLGGENVSTPSLMVSYFAWDFTSEHWPGERHLLPFCKTVNVAVLCALCSTLILPLLDAASVFAEEYHAGPGHENCTIAPAHARTVTI